jgi:hypothetical protein
MLSLNLAGPHVKKEDRHWENTAFMWLSWNTCPRRRTHPKVAFTIKPSGHTSVDVWTAVTGWTTEKSWFYSEGRQIFLFSKAPRLSVVPTQPFIWGEAAKEHSARVDRPDAKLTSHLPLGTVLRTYRAKSPLPRKTSRRVNLYLCF